MADVAESFRAEVMKETLAHRGHDAGLVDDFKKAVERHRARYLAKAAADAGLMSEISAIAERAIARAQAVGVLAFEPGV